MEEIKRLLRSQRRPLASTCRIEAESCLESCLLGVFVDALLLLWLLWESRLLLESPVCGNKPLSERGGGGGRRLVGGGRGGAFGGHWNRAGRNARGKFRRKHEAVGIV
eukprot:scaffold3131_cov64-Attheya_sp.AAC.2